MPGRLPNHGFREGSGEGSEPRVPGQVPGLLGITPGLISTAEILLQETFFSKVKMPPTIEKHTLYLPKFSSWG